MVHTKSAPVYSAPTKSGSPERRSWPSERRLEHSRGASKAEKDGTTDSRGLVTWTYCSSQATSRFFKLTGSSERAGLTSREIASFVRGRAGTWGSPEPSPSRLTPVGLQVYRLPRAAGISVVKARTGLAFHVLPATGRVLDAPAITDETIAAYRPGDSRRRKGRISLAAQAQSRGSPRPDRVLRRCRWERTAEHVSLGPPLGQ